jgi:septum formation inhibitor-activating ATPase MinD
MKTQLDWDSLRNQFRAKKSVLSVHVVKPGENVIDAANAGTSTILGEADFDLAYYANNNKVLSDKLPLRNCSIDENAFIEIYIKTNAEEILS